MLCALSERLSPKDSARIQDRKQGYADVCDERFPQPSKAYSAKYKHDEFYGKRTGDVLFNDASRLLGGPQRSRQGVQSVIGKNQVSRVHGGVGSKAAHGYTDVCAGKNRRVVYAIANKDQFAAVL